MGMHAYSRLAENRFRERFGLDFEDFRVGQKFRHRPGVTLSQQDNVDEALDTINAAMVHYDAKYAGQTAWKRELMVSTVTLQRLIGMSSKTFGRKHTLAGFSEIAMTAPVFGGDTLYAQSEILAVAPADDGDFGAVTVLCRGINQDEREIARVTYRVLVWRAGRHPEDRAGSSPAAVPVEESRFLAHRAEADGALTEQVGLFFEDCQAGETFVHWPRRTMLREEGMQHAWRSLELAPQYHDLDWIAQHGDGVFRFTEPWIVGVATAMTTRTFGRVVANLGWTDVSFGAAVAAGDTLEAESTILDKRDSKSRPNEGILGVETRAYNQRRELVMRYQRRLLVYRRDADTPYAAAGY
jgi:itaconyl-CoA hydratase